MKTINIEISDELYTELMKATPFSEWVVPNLILNLVESWIDDFSSSPERTARDQRLEQIYERTSANPNLDPSEVDKVIENFMYMGVL